MYYTIERHLKQSNTPSDLTIELCTYEHWLTHYSSSYPLPDFPKGYESIHFCKVESYPHYLGGALCIPIKNNFKVKRKILFYIQKNKITFLDDSDFISHLLERLGATKVWENPCLEGFLVDFFEELIINDLIYVEELENRISRLETAALNGDIPHFNHKMMLFRKELLTFHYYYSQLIDVSEVLLANENAFFNANALNTMHSFIRRVERLQNVILMLRDYAAQIRETYQAQIDIKQNNTMRLLTVITSIFLPLTLIAGWYGMNFAYMPELQWKYGYPFVMLLSLATTILFIWLCKKKKFL